MSGIPGAIARAPAPRSPHRRTGEVYRWFAGVHVPALALRATAFFALAVFCAAHWAALVAPAATGRVLLACAVVTSGGILVALSARMPRAAGTALRVALLLIVLVSALTAVGIPLKLLAPKGWDTLSDRVSGGLAVVGTVSEWPYAGPNAWLRLTTLMAAPLVLTLAAALAFWPRRAGAEHAKPARFVALALLVLLYGVAVAARPFDQDTLRGVGLLACLAAWLWLPRLRGREALAALAAIAIAGAIGLGLTARVASSEPWVDYRQWSWSLRKERTIAFDWRHSYGPLDWPRKGRTLLLIKAKTPQYWKAETLDRFDGRGWTSGAFADYPALTGPAGAHPKWVESVKVTVRGLRSDLVIGPGAVLAIDGAPGETMIRPNATYMIDGQLGSGDSYTVRGYTPDPTSKQMKAAPPPEALFSRYTTINLPEPGGFVAGQLTVPLRGSPGTGDPDAVAELEASRYARIYALAKRISAGAATNYDVVRKVGAYLENRYRYTERVPQHQYPLDAFLFVDKKGYCQHFSGAAALMLRMLGVPTRVATGFAPGTLNSDTREYVVRDLDAHSWIEVWFPGIGWVPFDPTPASAPASSQATSFTPLSEIASAARGNSRDRLPDKRLEAILGADPGGGGSVSATRDEGTPWGWIAAGVVLALAVLAALVTVLRRGRERRRLLPAPCGDADVDYLVRLLGRLGLNIDQGTTLYELEQRLQRLGGPEAAGYAQRLRRRRFADAAEPCPSRAERRHLRNVLAQAVGAGPLTRLHIALPDGQAARSGALKLRAVQRPR